MPPDPLVRSAERMLRFSALDEADLVDTYGCDVVRGRTSPSPTESASWDPRIRVIPDYCARAHRAPSSERGPQFLRLQTAAPVNLFAGETHTAGTIEDISAGGLYVTCGAPLRAGEQVRVEFPAASELGLSSLVLVGVVRHVRSSPSGEAGIGLAIERAESRGPEALRQLVSIFFGVTPGADGGEVKGDDDANFRYEFDERGGRLSRSPPKDPA